MQGVKGMASQKRICVCIVVGAILGTASIFLITKLKGSPEGNSGAPISPEVSKKDESKFQSEEFADFDEVQEYTRSFRQRIDVQRPENKEAVIALLTDEVRLQLQNESWKAVPAATLMIVAAGERTDFELVFRALNYWINRAPPRQQEALKIDTRMILSMTAKSKGGLTYAISNLKEMDRNGGIDEACAVFVRYAMGRDVSDRCPSLKGCRKPASKEQHAILKAFFTEMERRDDISPEVGGYLLRVEGDDPYRFRNLFLNELKRAPMSIQPKILRWFYKTGCMGADVGTNRELLADFLSSPDQEVVKAAEEALAKANTVKR